ncbi:MAG: YqgE/AlgH family protein [Proteobacteria bacterium]|nr:MAG: YqgE/AlgH family protein [Pseudomonadota bacterium]
MQLTSSNLRNQLLIAMPALGDPNFFHTVTLICEHNEEGCFGVTINRPLDMTVGDLLKQLDIDSIEQVVLDATAVNGGPVQPNQGFVIHDTSQSWQGTLHVGDNLSVTSSRDILEDIAVGKGPDNFLLALGCASWSAGQIEDELRQNAWLTCPASHQILFETPYEQRWQQSAGTLGVDVNLISDVVGHA